MHKRAMAYLPGSPTAASSIASFVLLSDEAASNYRSQMLVKESELQWHLAILYWSSV